MKYKKLIIILVAFIFSFIYFINPYIEDKVMHKNPFKDQIIRFHVRANSDMEEDQKLKLKVRDKILEEMGDKFKDTKTIEESRIIIQENMEEIRDIALEVIKGEGLDYDVDVFLGIDDFPIRRYGNMVFPQGKYETLLVTIGKGQGQNWWCVMFPPLCFVDITHSYAFNIEDNELGDFILDENETPKLKSKIVEVVKKIGKK